MGKYFLDIDENAVKIDLCRRKKMYNVVIPAQ